MPNAFVVDGEPSTLLLPGSAGEAFSIRVGDSLADVERRLILHTVRRCRTQEEAARILGVSTKTVYNKLRSYEARNRSSLNDSVRSDGTSPRGQAGVRDQRGAND